VYIANKKNLSLLRTYVILAGLEYVEQPVLKNMEEKYVSKVLMGMNIYVINVKNY
jgi:hypothetical protein